MSETDSSSDVEIVEPPTKTRKLEGAANMLPNSILNGVKDGLASKVHLFHSSLNVPSANV